MFCANVKWRSIFGESLARNRRPYQAFKTDTQSSADFTQCAARILSRKLGSALGAV